MRCVCVETRVRAFHTHTHTGCACHQLAHVKQDREEREETGRAREVEKKGKRAVRMKKAAITLLYRVCAVD